MIRKSYLAISVTLALLFAAAAGAADSRVGVIDLDRLMRESPQGRAVQESLRAEFGDKQRDLAAQQKTLRELEERLNRDRSVMGEAERTDLETRARSMQQKYTRQLSEVEDDFNNRRGEELGKLQRLVVREVQAHAKEAGFDLVLGAGVLFASPSTDLTVAVLKRLESLPAVGKPAAEPAKPAPAPKR